MIKQKVIVSLLLQYFFDPNTGVGVGVGVGFGGAIII